MPPVDQTALMLFVFIGLVIAGFVLVYIGQTIKNDARVGIDNDYNRARMRSGNRFVAIGVFVALSCGLGAVAMALLTVMPIQY